MNRLILAAAALLAGCAAVPADLRDHGIHIERASQYAPLAATRCVGRNAEFHSSAIVNYVLTEGGPHGIDIYTRTPGEFVRTIAAIPTQSAGVGSTVDIWLTPGAYAAPDKFVDRLVTGC